MFLILVHFLVTLLKSGLSMEETLFHKQVGQYLPNSAIAYRYAQSELECSVLCTRRKGCFSVNYKVKGLDQGLCELNNETISKEVAVTDADFVYLASMNPKEQTKTEELVIRSSCKEIFDDNRSLKNDIYHLRPKNSLENYQVYCHMTEISGCGEGGWTLVMKTNGNLETFTYGSAYWTNKEAYAVEDGLEGLTEKESKLPSYWNTPFKKICLGMSVNGGTKWMVLDYEASSLHSLFADGSYRNTRAGRAAWKSLIAGSSLQPHCNQEGFGINSHPAIRIRLGYLANNQNACGFADSCIGFGISYEACYMKSSITCGNIAQCGDNDNGKKLTAAFGYILVQ